MPPTRTNCLLGLLMSSQFFCRYFEWKHPGSKIIAILTPRSEFTNGTDYIMGIPIVPFSELESLLEKQVIAVRNTSRLPQSSPRIRDGGLLAETYRHQPVPFFSGATDDAYRILTL